MRFIVLILSFISGCSLNAAIQPIENIIGTWSFSEKGTDFEDHKLCNFLKLGKLGCSITELGFSDGFGDGEIYKTTGTWSINGSILLLSESPTYTKQISVKTKYTIISFTRTQMVLVDKFGTVQVWYSKSLN